MTPLDLETQSSTLIKNQSSPHTDLTQSEIVVVTICDNEPDWETAANNNSNSYVIRDPYLAQALRNISERYSKFETTTPCSVFDSRREKNNAELSDREEEVLEFLAKGASNKTIAANLFISENTVKTHLHHIMAKLNVENRSQAAVYAIKTKLSAKQ